MKHVKLFEGFNSMMSPGEGDYSMGTRKSFIVLTGSTSSGSFSVSHVNDPKEVNLLRNKFSGGEDGLVFNAIPYTGKNYVGSGFHDESLDITLKDYETAQEGIEYEGYSEMASRKDEDYYIELGDGDGIIWTVPPVGFTEHGQWGGNFKLIPNMEYFKMEI